jgi:hypothetical protein
MKALAPYFGVMTTPYPRSMYKGYTEEGRAWALDNGAYTKGEFEPWIFFDFLEACRNWWDKLLWAVIPDKVGDAATTMHLYNEWLPIFAEYPVRTAFVAQDGITADDLPERFDCLFIGGTDKFKQSKTAASCMKEAKRRKKWVHVGRVNTWQRLLWSYQNGADSVDGTCIAYGRDINLAKLVRWMKRIHGY